LDFEFRALEFDRQAIAALCVCVDLLANGFDPRAYLLELGFLGSRGCGLGKTPGTAS
jgi:hypothetical protein